MPTRTSTSPPPFAVCRDAVVEDVVGDESHPFRSPASFSVLYPANLPPPDTAPLNSAGVNPLYNASAPSRATIRRAIGTSLPPSNIWRVFSISKGWVHAFAAMHAEADAARSTKKPIRKEAGGGGGEGCWWLADLQHDSNSRQGQQFICLSWHKLPVQS